jgi:Sulfotransferase family
MMDAQDVEPCHEAFLSRPVLVYGPRKAGTTLLQSLLDGGPALLMLPDELKLKYMARPGWPWGKPAARWFIERGRSFFPDLFRIGPDGHTVLVDESSSFAGLSREQLEEILDPDKYASGLETLLRENRSDAAGLMCGDVRAFVGALKGGLGTKLQWGSKEVGGVPDRVTALFKRCFPEGRIVYLVRQPEFIVRSIILNRRRKGKRMSLRGLLHECRDAQNVVNFGYEHALQDGLVVSYETLTEDPAGVINRVCEKLGLPMDPIHAVPTTLGRPVVVVTSSRQTTQVFRQETDWRKDLTAREVFAIQLFRWVGPLHYRLRGRRVVRYDDLRDLLGPQGL